MQFTIRIFGQADGMERVLVNSERLRAALAGGFEDMCANGQTARQRQMELLL